MQCCSGKIIIMTAAAPGIEAATGQANFKPLLPERPTST